MENERHFLLQTCKPHHVAHIPTHLILTGCSFRRHGRQSFFVSFFLRRFHRDKEFQIPSKLRPRGTMTDDPSILHPPSTHDDEHRTRLYNAHPSIMGLGIHDTCYHITVTLVELDHVFQNEQQSGARRHDLSSCC